MNNALNARMFINVLIVNLGGCGAEGKGDGRAKGMAVVQRLMEERNKVRGEPFLFLLILSLLHKL